MDEQFGLRFYMQSFFFWSEFSIVSWVDLNCISIQVFSSCSLLLIEYCYTTADYNKWGSNLVKYVDLIIHLIQIRIVSFLTHEKSTIDFFLNYVLTAMFEEDLLINKQKRCFVVFHYKKIRD